MVYTAWHTAFNRSNVAISSEIDHTVNLRIFSVIPEISKESKWATIAGQKKDWERVPQWQHKMYIASMIDMVVVIFNCYVIV